jgi:hypothetical protein
MRLQIDAKCSVAASNGVIQKNVVNERERSELRFRVANLGFHCCTPGSPGLNRNALRALQGHATANRRSA